MEITSYLDLLYLCLSVLVVVITIFGGIVLIKVIGLLSHIENIMRAISSLIEIANAFMLKPVQILTMILEYVGKMINKQ